MEDDVDIAEMLDAYFRVKGYEVSTVTCGEDALDACRIHRPDLVILDIRLPDINGFEIARQLRDRRRTSNIPIIFLTEKRGRQDILQGFEMGAEDYITKPFDIQELRLRVRNVLNRSQQGSMMNVVTHLPEGALVDERLQFCLENANWVILVVALKQMDVFHDAYGFVKSDDVLRSLSGIVIKAVQEIGTSSDFIGHIEPFSLIAVTKNDVLTKLKQRIEMALKHSLAYFYPYEHLSDVDKNSDNKLDLAMKVVTPNDGPFDNLDSLKATLIDI